MEDIQKIIAKYDHDYVRDCIKSVDGINSYALAFYKDVAEIYDAITRVRNVERNPTGFSLDDAPILGLLTRVWKFLKLIIRFYEEENAEFISVVERPLIEAAVTASYLLTHEHSVVEDYRLCSYKDRLRILRDLEAGSAFFDTKAGQRLLSSVREKLQLEGLDKNSFSVQKKNRWRLQGKSFYDIFSEVANEEMYACVYGMMSESVHGSWNDSLDWCLSRNEDGTFSTFPFFHPPDIRFVSPTLLFSNPPYELWLKRIEADDPFLIDVLAWIHRFNTVLFYRFDELYDGPNPTLTLLANFYKCPTRTIGGHNGVYWIYNRLPH
jgi:hypothetical protein